MSDDEPKLKADTKTQKIQSKERAKAKRAGGDSSDEGAEKLFDGKEEGEAIFEVQHLLNLVGQ